MTWEAQVIVRAPDGQIYRVSRPLMTTTDGIPPVDEHLAWICADIWRDIQLVERLKRAGPRQSDEVVKCG